VSYQVKTEFFEGPFDLLLHLVYQQRLDIGRLAISEIADQYLEEVSRMPKLDLEVASDCLLVAATLPQIKVQSLLPGKTEDIDEELEELSPTQVSDILTERLLVYKKYKNAAAELSRRFEKMERMFTRSFGPDARFLSLMPDYLEDVSLDALAYLAASCLARREVFLLESEHIAAKPIPVEVHVRAIHGRIKNKKNLNFSDLVDKYTPSSLVVVSFLALLELYKRGMVTLTQDKSFGDISISYIEGSPDLILDHEDELTSIG